MQQLVGSQGQPPWDHADHTGTDEQWVQGNSTYRGAVGRHRGTVGRYRGTVSSAKNKTL